MGYLVNIYLGTRILPLITSIAFGGPTWFGPTTALFVVVVLASFWRGRERAELRVIEEEYSI